MNNQASQTLLQIKLRLQNITMVLTNTTNTSVKIYSYRDGEFTGWVSSSSPQLLKPTPWESSETHPGSPSKWDAVSLYLWTWILQLLLKGKFQAYKIRTDHHKLLPKSLLGSQRLRPAELKSLQQLSPQQAQAVSTCSLAQQQLTPEQWPAPGTGSQPQKLRTVLCSNTPQKPRPQCPTLHAMNTHTHHTLLSPLV